MGLHQLPSFTSRTMPITWAYDLSKIGASWNDDEGINRARHTFATFFKCYHRATVLRVKVAFLAVKAAGLELRFEEAAVL